MKAANMHPDIRKIIRMERKVERISVARVNAELKRRGRLEKLTRGRGYYYFRDGSTHRWPETMVMVNRVDAMSLDQWIAERDRLAIAIVPPPMD